MATGNVDVSTTTSTAAAPTAGQIPNTAAGETTAFYGQARPTYIAPTASISEPITAPGGVTLTGDALSAVKAGNNPYGVGTLDAGGLNTQQTGVYGSYNTGFSTGSMGDPIQHNYGGWGATYYGPVARVDNTIIGDGANNGGFNHLLLNLPPTFERLIQQEVLVRPRFWHDRIPRGAFQLFNGTTGETNIFRGALYKFAGLDEWTDINPVPTATNNPCASGSYDTIKYGWERLVWSGKKAYWGSDPICLDSLKFSVKVQEQLAMILSAGAEYGIQMQEVWNRDMFIYQSVLFGRSFVMSTDFYGPTDSPRYYYNPFVKITTDIQDYGITGPFILVDARSMSEIQPLNFDVLDQVRESLKIRCPAAAVSRGNGEPLFALAVSTDEIERYIRGNEEERRYWLEYDPKALIQHYGFAPSTFKRWVITNDGNQLRFKFVRTLTWDEDAQEVFAEVGADFPDDATVLVAQAVDPQVVSTTRVGIGGSPIPEDNPDYYRAELAIAPIFMNQVFTNLFVPTVSTLGSGTYFGPVTGLNGKWGWTNFRDSTNPEGNVGKFFGKFEIVPRPETCVFHCTSFLYRRCMTPIRTICPSENAKINPDLDVVGGLDPTSLAQDDVVVRPIDADHALVTLAPGKKFARIPEVGEVLTFGDNTMVVEAMRSTTSMVVGPAPEAEDDNT